MAGTYIQVPADSTGKRVDTVTLTDATVEVHRQKIVIAGFSGTAEAAAVVNSAPGVNTYGLTVRHAGTATVAGIVSIAGTATVTGAVSITGTATVEGKVTLSGTATVVGNVSITGVVACSPIAISGTAIVAGIVTIAGSATVNGMVSITGTVVVNGMVSITGTIACSPIAISGTAVVAGIVTVSGTATIAGIVNLSGTATVAGDLSVTFASAMDIFAQPVQASTSRGPRCVNISASANAVVVSAPGAGMTICVTGLFVTNASGTLTKFRAGTSAANRVTMVIAGSGGGFCMNFTPPWVLSANEHLMGNVKPSVSEAIVNAHFYVASADNL